MNREIRFLSYLDNRIFKGIIQIFKTSAQRIKITMRMTNILKVILNFKLDKH